MEEAIDCLGSSIAFAMADKANVPKPSRLKRGQKLVPVPLWIVAKLALHFAIRELGMNQSQLARRLKEVKAGCWPRHATGSNHNTRPRKVHGRRSSESVGSASSESMWKLHEPVAQA